MSTFAPAIVILLGAIGGLAPADGSPPEPPAKYVALGEDAQDVSDAICWGAWEGEPHICSTPGYELHAKVLKVLLRIGMIKALGPGLDRVVDGHTQANPPTIGISRRAIFDPGDPLNEITQAVLIHEYYHLLHVQQFGDVLEPNVDELGSDGMNGLVLQLALVSEELSVLDRSTEHNLIRTAWVESWETNGNPLLEENKQERLAQLQRLSTKIAERKAQFRARQLQILEELNNLQSAGTFPEEASLHPGGGQPNFRVGGERGGVLADGTVAMFVEMDGAFVVDPTRTIDPGVDQVWDAIARGSEVIVVGADASAPRNGKAVLVPMGAKSFEEPIAIGLPAGTGQLISVAGAPDGTFYMLDYRTRRILTLLPGTTDAVVFADRTAFGDVPFDAIWSLWVRESGVVLASAARASLQTDGLFPRRFVAEFIDDGTGRATVAIPIFDDTMPRPDGLQVSGNGHAGWIVPSNPQWVSIFGEPGQDVDLDLHTEFDVAFLGSFTLGSTRDTLRTDEPVAADRFLTLYVDGSPWGAYPVAEAPFIRGDANADGFVDISDAVKILNYLFMGDKIDNRISDRFDANDDGSIDLSDSVALLNFLFGSAPEPPAPFPAPGVDPTLDDLPPLAPPN